MRDDEWLLVGGEENLRVEPLGPEELLHLRRRVERRLQDLRRDRLPHRRPTSQVAKDRAAFVLHNTNISWSNDRYN